MKATSMRAGAAVLASVLAILLTFVPARGAEADDPEDSLEQTPPRLSLVDGQVSFWRPGAQDWTQAQVNIPLAPGDALATGSPGTFEVQIGAAAFVRAWGNTQLILANREADFIQFMLTAGSAVVDLRTLEPGRTVEVDTPNAAVTMMQAGYYRVDVIGARARVLTRRGGLATVTLASGEAVTVPPSEEVTIEGTENPSLAAATASPGDDWDRWNDTRTDWLLGAASARYVPAGTYGLRDLDRYGTWRAVPTYGTVWVPTGVPAGWAPYSTGSWILDPVYGWTWVDTAPWGWAPYHHGRWCFVGGYWAWAPGPLIATPVYAPALVAFLDEPSQGALIGSGGPIVGWVALGWGEPVVPWWGHRRHRPSWHGWGGPRIVNKAVIHDRSVVNVQNITVYRNASVPHAVVAVDRTRFGRGPTAAARVRRVDPPRMKPVHGPPQVSATAASFSPTVVRGVPPPEESLKRPVVATRSVGRESDAGTVRAQTGTSPAVFLPPQRVVPLPGPRQPVPGGEAERPGRVPVAPSNPRPADARPSAGRATGTAPETTGKRPSGSPAGTGHPIGPSPTARPAEPKPPTPAKELKRAPSSGATEQRKPQLGPTPRRGERDAGAMPSVTAPTMPPRTVQPGPSSRDTGTVRDRSSAVTRRPNGPGSAGAPRPVETPRSPGRGSALPRPEASAPGSIRIPGPARAAPGLGTEGSGVPRAMGYTGGAPGRAVRQPETSLQPAPRSSGPPANRLAPGRGPKGAASSGEPKR
ncbi:MAG TPA: DUF6600 domain-containing protein [Methylomirabilota bacterium]|jgi:hypothetical protein|nr:DUF6600 domain-containing protein [Methylomirabilota bacterium]